MEKYMAEKPNKYSRKISDASNKKNKKTTFRGRTTLKKSDGWRGQTQITSGVVFPCWTVLREEKGMRADDGTG